MDQLDPAIALYVSKELLRAAQLSGSPKEIAEAKYGLAVQSINKVIDRDQGDNSLEVCLKWITEAASAGCVRAQAFFYRTFKIILGRIPDSFYSLSISWMLNAASKGFFQPLEDMYKVDKDTGMIDDALETLRFRYSGTGLQRYDNFPQRREGPEPWRTKPSLIKNFDNDLTKIYKSRDMGYIRGGRGPPHGDTILHHAASCGLRKTVVYLIENDPDNINHTTIIGETPLLLACRSGHYFVTMDLLEAGADPKIASDNGETPLHWLLSFDSRYVREICRNLVAKLDQHDLNAVASECGYIYCGENKYVGGTPLMRAIARNRSDVVQVLLEAGADPSIVVKGGSALNLAVQLHYPHIIRVLIPKLPKNTLRDGTVERSTGCSLLMIAICGGSLGRFGILFSRIGRHGCQWSSRARETLHLLMELGPKEDLHNIPGYPGCSALCIAAMYAAPDIVEFFLEQGGKDDIEKPSPILGWPEALKTPLMASILSRDFRIFRLLIENGANTKTLSDDPSPCTLLYECARSSNDRIEFAQALIDSGVKVDQSPVGHETPFACALRSRCFNLAKCLWENGADVNIEYTSGDFISSAVSLTVLGQLIREYSISSLSCLSFLFCHEPRLSAANFIVSHSESYSALHVIAMAPYEKQNDRELGLVLGCILDYFKPSKEQLSLQCSDETGNTALHIAVFMSNYPTVQGLLNAGADPSIKNKWGYDSVDTAHHTLKSLELGIIQAPERTAKKTKERAKDIIKTIESAHSDRPE
jgi:ankyrin repeat protein